MAHNPLLSFILQASLVILAARLIGLVARRLRQPMVIFEIAAGIALGPSLLGWLAPAAEATLFPKESLGHLSMMSQVGLLLFMFLVGLELDTSLLRSRIRAAVLISHMSIVVPFGLGALLALVLSARLSPPSVPFRSFMMFMGLSMSITAFPVLARILSERRLLRTELGAIAISCAAVDDITCWCILAFIIAIVRATSLTAAGVTVLLVFGYIGFMLKVVRPLAHRFLTRVSTSSSQPVVALTLLFLFASSAVTEVIGIHALFGAFLWGVVIPRDRGVALLLAEKLEDLVVVFMLPLFFAYSGLRTQIGLLNHVTDWLVCGGIIVVACIGKFGGSVVAARLAGLGWRQSSAIGILMNTRGLVELVVLNIGYDFGLISPTLFTMLVIMALVTTFMTSPLLRAVVPSPPPPVHEASAGTVEPHSVLMWASHKPTGPALVTLAAALSRVGTGTSHGKVFAVDPRDPGESTSFLIDQREQRTHREELGPIFERARKHDLAVEPLSFVSSEPGNDIRGVADRKGVDVVLLGCEQSFTVGTVVHGAVRDVMRDIDADVGIFVERNLRALERILVPFNGSRHDAAALRYAARIASSSGGKIKVLHVVTPPGGDPPAVLPVLPGVSNIETIEHPDPSEAVVAAAEGYDLVVIGASRHWGLERRRFGVRSETILRHTPTSILVIQEGERGAGAASVPPASVR